MDVASPGAFSARSEVLYITSLQNGVMVVGLTEGVCLNDYLTVMM